MIRISDIRIPAAPREAELQALEAKLNKLLGIKMPVWRVARQSLDARKKPEILSVYSLDVDLGCPETEAAFLHRNLQVFFSVFQ